MGNFNTPVFVHALYVAFGYAMLAWGATAYRQVLDNLSVKDARLGEDMFYCYDPISLMWVGVLAFIWLIAFIGTVFIAPTAEVHLYIIPLALFVNVLQFAYRIKHQRLHVTTLGLIGRNIFTEKFEAISYHSIRSVAYSINGMWSIISLRYIDNNAQEHEFRRYVYARTFEQLLPHLQRYTSPETLFTNDVPKTSPISK